MIRWWSEVGITLAYLMTPLAEGVLEEKIPAGLELPTRALIPRRANRTDSPYGRSTWSPTSQAGPG